MHVDVGALESALRASRFPDRDPAAGEWRRRLIARGRLALGVVLIVGAVLWGAVSAAPAMAASPPGTITSFTDPGMSEPYVITPGPDGALWFTNFGTNSIGRITTSGSVTIYTGPEISQPHGIVAGPDGALWFANTGPFSTGRSIGRISTDGTVADYTGPGISGPDAMAVGSDGALWFTNFGSNSIGRITTGGTVTNYTGPGIINPGGIAAGPDGALWFSNQGSDSIGRITTSGAVTIYTDPRISEPLGIAAGPDGALWFANGANSSIGRITTTGAVTIYTDPRISAPSGITAGPDGALWFTNQGDNSIGRITTSGAVTSYADPAISAPLWITVGPDGALWFTNYANNSIGRIQPSGPVIVSELRLTGAGSSPGDQYIDLYNSSGTAVSLGGWTLDWTSGVSSGSVALGDVILPAGGHYLVAGSGYSLSVVAMPDQTVALPASLSGVSLIEPDGSTVSDSVGYVGSGDVVGTGLTAPVYPAGSESQVAFVRRYANGAPVGTGDNQSDFQLLAADETGTATPSYGQPTFDPPVLGTASPLDSRSAVQVNGVAQSSLLYPSEGESDSGNLAYTPPVSGPVSHTNPGTLLLSRTITNVSDQSAIPETITRLQIRVTGLSTYGEGAIADPGDPAAAAVLSDTSSSDQTVSGPTACPGDDQVLGTSLAGTGAGGLNSVLTVALPAGGLAPGGCLNVVIAFAVDQTGPFALAYNVEDDLRPSTSTSTSTSTSATPAPATATPLPTAGAPAPPALAGTITPAGVTATTTPTVPSTATTTTATATTTTAQHLVRATRARGAQHRHRSTTRRAQHGHRSTTRRAQHGHRSTTRRATARRHITTTRSHR